MITPVRPLLVFALVLASIPAAADDGARNATHGAMRGGPIVYSRVGRPTAAADRRGRIRAMGRRFDRRTNTRQAREHAIHARADGVDRAGRALASARDATRVAETHAGNEPPELAAASASVGLPTPGQAGVLGAQARVLARRLITRVAKARLGHAIRRYDRARAREQQLGDELAQSSRLAATQVREATFFAPASGAKVLANYRAARLRSSGHTKLAMLGVGKYFEAYAAQGGEMTYGGPVGDSPLRSLNASVTEHELAHATDLAFGGLPLRNPFVTSEEFGPDASFELASLREWFNASENARTPGSATAFTSGAPVDRSFGARIAPEQAAALRGLRATLAKRHAVRDQRSAGTPWLYASALPVAKSLAEHRTDADGAAASLGLLNREASLRLDRGTSPGPRR